MQNQSQFPIQLSKEAILLHRYPDAVQLLKPLSRAGDLEATFLHGYLHFWDDDLSQADAVQLVTAAAAAGHPEANYLLAVCPDLTPGYRFQLPTTPLQKEYLQRAADLGSAAARTDLAQMYLDGIGCEPDPVLARDLLTRAYMQGRTYPKCNLLLGKMLLNGIGGAVDFDAGLHRLRRCSGNYGDPFAVEAFTLLREAGQQLLYNIRPSQQAKFLQEVEPPLERIREHTFPLWQRYLEHYCINTLTYDLRGASFEAFVSFVFDHWPRLERDRDRDRDPNQRKFKWDQEAVVFFEPKTLLQHYIRLLREPAFLLDWYTHREISRGFDVIRDFNQWTMACVMMSAENTVDDAEACIRATYDLFAKLFSHGYFDGVPYMWWDWGYGCCGSSRGGTTIEKRQSDIDAGRLYQANFETMARVLQLDAYECRRAAIHGLGHSSHPGKVRVLYEYLETHPRLDEENRLYVMNAINGTIL